MNWLSYIFSAIEENPGELSIIRICVLIIVVTACVIACVYASSENVTLLVCGMIATALTGKVTQKFFEK